MNYKEIHTISDLKNIENTIIGTQLCKDMQNVNANAWILSFSPSIIRHISSAYIKNFIQVVMHHWRQQITSVNATIPATFYMWFDEQVGHVCFNLLFVPKDALPFGCTIRFVDMDVIIHSLLTSSIQGGVIPLSEISEECHNEDVEDEINIVLPVCAVNMRQQQIQ
jgi:hypothetical protein